MVGLVLDRPFPLVVQERRITGEPIDSLLLLNAAGGPKIHHSQLHHLLELLFETNIQLNA